jgi:putative heme-binding domain-containing protein
MRRSLRPLAAALAVLACGSTRTPAEEDPYAQFIPPTGPLAPEEERAQLKVPPGFEVELFAAEPAIRKPMNIACDERGRLWLTESVEYPFPVKEGAEGRDAVRILEDADGDGRAEKVTLFASGLNIPIGVAPIPGGAIVYSIPKLWKLIDRDGDDRADEKQELYGTFGHGDTHGMVNGLTWGFDGWLYACHGYANASEVRGADGSLLKMRSGNTWRMRADGSRVEPFSFGQVNPFGLCFDPLGNLYSTDCHSQAAYLLLRGGQYPTFDNVHDGLGFPPLMIDHDHQSTGISGIAYYAAEQFPPEYRDCLFTGNVITNRVNADRVERRGSGAWAVHRPDLVESGDPWFRPVDLEVAPDGSLFIADFYNKVIGHYEVPLTHPARDRERGRIWRIVHRGGDASRGRRPQSAWVAAGRAAGDPARLLPELLADLASPNLTVRLLAVAALARAGGDAAALHGALARPANGFQAAAALWVLERRGDLAGGELHEAARSADATVRVHAQRVLGERRELGAARALVLAGLADSDPLVRRCAAEALARHPAAENLPPLLALLASAPREDAHLIHAARIALREQLRVPEAWAAAAGLDPAGKDAEAVAGVALAVPRAEAAVFLARRAPGTEPKPEALRHMARYLPEEERDRLLPDIVRGGSTAGLDRRSTVIEALVKGCEERGGGIPAWVAEAGGGLAGDLLAAGAEDRAARGIQLARSLKLDRFKDRIAALALSPAQPDRLRAEAFAAVAALDPAGRVPILGRILANPEEKPAIRELAAAGLGDLEAPEAVEALAAGLRAAHDALAAKIAAALARRRPGGERLLEEIEQGRASPRLLARREVQLRLAGSGIDDLETRVKKLTAGIPDAEEKAAGLIAARREGFARASPEAGRGAAVFAKTCGACHRAAGQGNKVGPELEGIGKRGLDRLLEDVLDPNRNIDQAFRTTVIVTRDGLARTGLFLREEGAVLVLADQEGKSFTVPAAEVESRELSNLSPMPADIAEKLPEAEFYDLLAFLLGLTAAPASGG